MLKRLGKEIMQPQRALVNLVGSAIMGLQLENEETAGIEA